MDIVAGLAAAANAISITKTLKNLEQTYDAAQFKIQIADLLDKLADTKLALTDAKETLAARDGEIVRLKQSQADRCTLVEGEGGYKFRSDEDGKKLGFPICPKCDPVDGRLVQLVQNDDVRSAICPVCSSSFQPVTCYLANGNTLAEQHRDERRRKIDEQSRRLNANRGGGSWMGN